MRQQQRLVGQGETRVWIQEASESDKFVTKKVGTHVNPADLMTKPQPRPKIEQLVNVVSYRFVGITKGNQSYIVQSQRVPGKLQNEV